MKIYNNDFYTRLNETKLKHLSIHLHNGIRAIVLLKKHYAYHYSIARKLFKVHDDLLHTTLKNESENEMTLIFT